MSGSINQLRTVSNSGEVESSHAMGISDAWKQPLRVVTVKISYKTKDRLWNDRLDAPQSFIKTIKHSVVRTRAMIDNKQIAILQLTRNFCNQELTTRTLEPSLMRNRKTIENKKPIPSPFGRAPLNRRDGALKPGKSNSDICLRLVTFVSAQAITSKLVTVMANSSLLLCRLLMLVNITLQHWGTALGPGLTSTSGNRIFGHP